MTTYTIDGIPVTEEELRQHLDQREADQLAQADTAEPPAEPASRLEPGEEIQLLQDAWPGYVFSHGDAGWQAFDPGTNHTFIEADPDALSKALEAQQG